MHILFFALNFSIPENKRKIRRKECIILEKWTVAGFRVHCVKSSFTLLIYILFI